LRFQVTNRTIEQYGSKLGLQGDNNIETVDFVLPRYYNGIDLNDGIAFVCFSTESGQSGFVPGIEKKLEGENLVLTWLVGSQVTQEPGLLSIGLKISGLNETMWNSEITAFQISHSIQVESPQAVAFVSPRIGNPENEPPITIAERTITIPPVLQNIAVQNDQRSETVVIRAPRYFDGNDLSKYTFVLRTLSAGGYDPVSLLPIIGDSELSMEWVLKPPQTSFPGTLSIQLWVTGENFDWHSDSASVNILTELDGEPVIPMQPSIIDDFIKQISIIANQAKESASEAKDSAEQSKNQADRAEKEADRAQAQADRVEDAVVKGPIIGDDGHWYVWDFELNQYVQTDSVANGNVMFATFAIDPETGILTMATPEGYKGASFEIKNDYLEVIV
jgi:hypothetical protein